MKTSRLVVGVYLLWLMGCDGSPPGQESFGNLPTGIYIGQQVCAFVLNEVEVDNVNTETLIVVDSGLPQIEGGEAEVGMKWLIDIGDVRFEGTVTEIDVLPNGMSVTADLRITLYAFQGGIILTGSDIRAYQVSGENSITYTQRLRATEVGGSNFMEVACIAEFTQ